jgi:hypothetical protein
MINSWTALEGHSTINEPNYKKNLKVMKRSQNGSHLQNVNRTSGNYPDNQSYLADSPKHVQRQAEKNITKSYLPIKLYLSDRKSEQFNTDYC